MSGGGCATLTCGIMYTTMISQFRTSSGAALRAPSAEVDAPAPRGGEVPAIGPIDAKPRLKTQAYAALKNVIVGMDVYKSRAEIRLDERKLAADLGISRTPVREALSQLEREGFVRSVPRRGICVARKTKSEVIELIAAWAALESMAARLATQNAGDEDIAALRKMFATFEGGEVQAKLDEYSEVNIEFHQAIIRMSKNRVLIDLACERIVEPDDEREHQQPLRRDQ